MEEVSPGEGHEHPGGGVMSLQWMREEVWVVEVAVEAEDRGYA